MINAFKDSLEKSRLKIRLVSNNENIKGKHRVEESRHVCHYSEDLSIPPSVSWRPTASRMAPITYSAPQQPQVPDIEIQIPDNSRTHIHLTTDTNRLWNTPNTKQLQEGQWN